MPCLTVSGVGPGSKKTDILDSIRSFISLFLSGGMIGIFH
jgi:hypothetical protein